LETFDLKVTGKIRKGKKSSSVQDGHRENISHQETEGLV
jgi:hypothetical protein